MRFDVNGGGHGIPMTYIAEKPTGVSGSRTVYFPAYSMLALTLIGMAAAIYVAQGNYTGQPLWCPILDGCNAVVNSPYSRVLGVPMSYFGFMYYLYMFALAARLAFEPFSKSLRFRAILYAAVGAVSSNVLYVPSAPLYSRGVQLLRHRCGHVVPPAFRGAVALSSHPPFGHEKLISRRSKRCLEGRSRPRPVILGEECCPSRI
jgi:uncharacterized membrane protein